MELSHKKAVFMSFRMEWNKTLKSGSKTFKLAGYTPFYWGNNE